MSVLRSRSSLTTTKVFLLSGIPGDQRKDLAKKITLLGGKYFDIEDFKAQCTHVICGKLSRSEKFLGACATGKWILHPDYIIQSTVAKDWLDEEQFEWCDDNITRKSVGIVPLELAYASRRWRFMLGNQSRAFSGWKVAVVAGAKRSKVIKRLLISGGADVFNLKIPIKNPEKVANTICYIFVSEQNITSVGHLLEYGVLCIRPEFIGDYLIKDPSPDPMDYVVQTSNTTAQDQALNDAGSDTQSFLLPSQLDPPSSQPSSIGDHGNANSPSKIIASPAVQNAAIDIKPEPPFALSQENHTSTHSVSLPKKATSDSSGSQQSESSSAQSSELPKCSLKLIKSRSNDSDPGPSGAASQTGGQKLQYNLEPVQNLHVNKSVDQSVSCGRKMTPSATITSSDHSAAVLNSVILCSKPQDKSQLDSSSKTAGDRPKKKKSKESTLISFNETINTVGTATANNEDKPLLWRSLSESTADKSVIRTSQRLKTSKSEPSWKDLIPKKRSSPDFSEVKQNTGKRKNENLLGKTQCEMKESEVECQKFIKSEPRDVPSEMAVTQSSDMNLKDSAPVTQNTNVEKDSNNCNVAAVKIKSEPAMLPEVEAAQGKWQERRRANTVLLQPSVSTTKKKRTRQDADLHSILKEIKRQKVSQCEWRPTVFALDPCSEAENDSVVMPMLLTEIIHSSFDEKLSKQTAVLDELSCKISKKYVPQPKTLHALMVDLLLGAKTDLEANKAYQVLMKILRLHPPTSSVVQDVYRRSLSIVSISGIEEEETALGADWVLIKDCIRNVISGCQTSDTYDSQVERNSKLLLRYLTSLIEQDLQNYMLHRHHIQEARSRPLLVRILWSPSYHVVLNSKCRELLDLMTETLMSLRTSKETKQKDNLLTVLKSIVWWVAMATECCRLSEAGCPESVTVLQCEKTGAFIHEVAKKITDASITDPGILQIIFSSLQFPWQCVGVSQQLLNGMDDYLLADEQVRDVNGITLSHIVSRYFFLLPRFNVRSEHVARAQASPAKRQRDLISSKSKKKECLIESNEPSAENIAKLSEKVNKKNHKGETPLHTACIKGDVNKLKQLLKVPGVDVNMKDNAGWTPLHEACNHGSVQCVQELLKFVPAKTMEFFFKKDSVVLRKVDVLAKTDEGITPLHDAVLNNRMEVCRLLLQHGGHKLLAAVTCLNYTPLQLAESEEMYSLLSSYLPPPRRQSDSQEMSFSQDSMVSVEETRTELPPDHLYEEVTMNGNTRIFPDKLSLATFIYLVTCLLKNYIKAADVETVRDKIKDKLQNLSAVSKSRQKILSDCETLNRESSQEVDTTEFSSQESNPLTPTERLTLRFTKSGEFSDKENRRSPFSEKNHCSLHALATQRSCKVRMEPEENRVNKELIRTLKKDLRVLKNIPKHIEMFRSHLQKLCAKDDRDLIEAELFEISVIVDYFIT